MHDVAAAGGRIRDARQRLGWSAQDFAVKMGCASQTVYRWEWGVSRPSRARYQVMALVLGVSLQDLVGS